MHVCDVLHDALMARFGLCTLFLSGRMTEYRLYVVLDQICGIVVYCAVACCACGSSLNVSACDFNHRYAALVVGRLL